MKANHIVFLLILIFFSVSVFIDFKSNSFELVDFKVYYQAALNLKNQLPIYQISENNHYQFKYSPVFAISMIPFTFLNYNLAKILFLIIILGFLFFSFEILNKEFKSKFSYELISFFILIIFSKHIQKEIHLGQINIGLFFLLLASVYYRKTSLIKSSLLFIFSIFIKPIGLALTPFYFFTREYKNLLGFIIAFWLLIFLSFIFIEFHIYFNWIYELKTELISKSNLKSIDTQTIFAAIHRFLGLNSYLSLFIGIIIWIFIQIAIYKKYQKHFFYFLISTIPLVICTSNNFYILAIPLFYFMISKFDVLNLFQKGLVIFSSTLMCFNQYELWGRAGVDMIDHYTPYSLSVLLGLVSVLSIKKGV